MKNVTLIEILVLAFIIFVAVGVFMGDSEPVAKVKEAVIETVEKIKPAIVELTVKAKPAVAELHTKAKLGLEEVKQQMSEQLEEFKKQQGATQAPMQSTKTVTAKPAGEPQPNGEALILRLDRLLKSIEDEGGSS